MEGEHVTPLPIRASADLPRHGRRAGYHLDKQGNRLAPSPRKQLTAARAVNDKQEEVLEKLSKSHKIIENVHDTLVHQFLKLAASTKDFKHKMFQAYTQYKINASSKDEGDQQDCAQAGTHDGEQKLGNVIAGGHKPKRQEDAYELPRKNILKSQEHKVISHTVGSAEQLRERNKPSAQSSQHHHNRSGGGPIALESPAGVVNIMPNQESEEATTIATNKERIGRQDQQIKSQPSSGGGQAEACFEPRN